MAKVGFIPQMLPALDIRLFFMLGKMGASEKISIYCSRDPRSALTALKSPLPAACRVSLC